MRFSSIRLRRKSNSVCDAEGKPTSISLKPIRTSMSKSRSLRSAFIGSITQNGLFVAFTALVVTLPLFLPLAVSVASGEAVAGEASIGTLRNLLVVPVSRTRVLVVKYVGILAFSVAAAFTVAIAGVLVGLALFPVGPVTLLGEAHSFRSDFGDLDYGREADLGVSWEILPNAILRLQHARYDPGASPAASIRKTWLTFSYTY